MNKELTTKLLSIYRDVEQRDNLKFFMPVDWNERKWCAATEGHQFIMIPENADNKLPEPPIKTVNIAAIMPVFNMCQEIDIARLKEVYDSVKMIERDVTKECECCEGVGRFEHYGDTYDCQNCDEDGEVKTGKKETVKDDNVFMKVGIAVFVNRFIKNLLDVIAYTNCQRLEIRSQKEFGLTVFELGNQVLIGIASKGLLNSEEGDIIVSV